jgi:hypothetical protein
VVTAPPSVDLRPPDDDGGADDHEPNLPGSAPAAPPVDPGDDELSRINLRLPTQLKGRVEQAAARDGLSINAWLVRAAAAAVERDEAPPSRVRRAPRGGAQFTGWVR